MKFFNRKSKSKANLVPNDVISPAPSTTPSESPVKQALSKSSRRSKFSKSSKSTNSTHDNPVVELQADTRQDINVATTPTVLQEETREEDIFFINTITTSSASDTDEEVSHLSFDEQVIEKTTMLKQYVVDHLLGCVDLIEDCAENMKDTRRAGDGASTVNDYTVGNGESKKEENMDQYVSNQVISPSSLELESKRTTTDSEALATPERTQPLLRTDKSPFTVSQEEASTQAALGKQIETTTPAIAPNFPTKDAQEIPTSKYTNIIPSTPNPYDDIVLKTNKDYLLALTNIDAIIDSQVAHMVEEMCICGDVGGMCGGVDDMDEFSQFQELPRVSDDCENMLFQ
ncbi:hypothetical protein ACHAXN_003296 [Cyclotella atomus]|jgi:hypothetical protein